MRERFQKVPHLRLLGAPIAVTPILPKLTAAVPRDAREQDLAVTSGRMPAEGRS